VVPLLLRVMRPRAVFFTLYRPGSRRYDHGAPKSSGATTARTVTRLSLRFPAACSELPSFAAAREVGLVPGYPNSRYPPWATRRCGPVSGMVRDAGTPIV